MYQDVARNLEKFVIETPQTFLPNPNDEEYNNGYIRRYFVRKSNDINAFIYEVSSSTSAQYTKIPFWKTTSIRWRITGNIDDIKKSNVNSIALVAKEFPTLALYLPNLTQFYKS